MMDPRVVVYHAPFVTSTAAEIDNTLMTREVPVQIGDRSCAPRLQAIRGRHRCFPSASQHRAGLLLLVLVLLSVAAIVPPCLTSLRPPAWPGPGTSVSASFHSASGQLPLPGKLPGKTAAEQHPLESGSGRHRQEKETASKLQKL